MVGVMPSIVHPNLGEQNHELRHGRINMIERMQFHGLPSEDHVLHLKKFLRLIDRTRSLANAYDYIKLATFLLSLAGKAEDWLYDLRNRNITTWDQCLT